MVSLLKADGSMNFPSSSVHWLMLLYGIQGVPYGFQVAFLPILLHAGGASLTKVSLMRALNLPWMLKLLWVPMVTSSTTIKRPLTFSLAGLSVVFTASSMISAQSAWILSGILLAVNILVSVQDIAVDTFAIQNLTEREMGMGNAIQVVAYKVGAMFGGGVMTWASQFCSWSLLMVCVATVYLMSVIAIYLGLPDHGSDSDTDKKEVDKKWPPYTSAFLNGDFPKSYEDGLSNFSAGQNHISTSETDKSNSNQVVQSSHGYNPRSSSLTQRKYDSAPKVLSNKVLERTIRGRQSRREENKLDFPSRRDTCTETEQNAKPRTLHLFEDFAAILRVPGTSWLLLYLLIYKLGEQGAISIFPLYLMDSNVSTNQVAFWTGLLAQWVSIAGSLLGGWLLNHKTKQRSLSMELSNLSFWRFITLSIMSFMIWLDGKFNSLILCLPLYLILLLGGAITTATFTMMMTASQRASQPSIQTLHHTVMATAEVLGKVVFTSLAGLLVDQTGYVTSFIVFASLSVSPILPLYKITMLGISNVKDTQY